MRKEDICLDLTKLTEEQVKNIGITIVNNNELIHDSTLLGLMKGNNTKFRYLYFYEKWTRCDGLPRTEINLQQFKELFKEKSNVNDYIKESFNKLKEVGLTFEEASNTIKLNVSTNLKVGQEIEVNGFVLKVDREVEKWYKISQYNSKRVFFEKRSKKSIDVFSKTNDFEIEEITNKDFINQLEIFSK